MNAESKTTMGIAFEEARAEEQVIAILRNFYTLFYSGDIRKFTRAVWRLTRAATKSAAAENASLEQDETVQSMCADDGQQHSDRLNQASVGRMDVIENDPETHSHRTPNEQDHARVSERPSEPSPAQPNSAEADLNRARAEYRKTLARVASNGAGTETPDAFRVRSAAPRSTYFNSGQSPKQREVDKKIVVDLYKSVFEATKLGDGRSWSKINGYELTSLRGDGYLADEIWMLIGSRTHPSDFNRPVSELMGEDEFRACKVRADARMLKGVA